MTPEVRQGILATAQSLGMDPKVLATIISYETAGTFDPTKRGPVTQWGQHRGFIQFGEPQAKQFGVDWANPVASQLGPNGAVAKYYRQNGWKPGMTELDAYSIVNAGAPGRYNASDANNGGAPGTVADKVNNQFGAHRQKAMSLLGGAFAQGGAQPLTYGAKTPAMPGTGFGLAQMFAGDPSALSMGAPVDPFASNIMAQNQQRQERQRDEEEATQIKRRALLSGVGAMFS